LGSPLVLSGQQMYIRCNTPRIQVGLPRVDDGPTVFAHDSIGLVGIAPAGGVRIVPVTFDDADLWCDEDDAALLVYVAREQAESINFFKGPYQFAGRVDGDSVTPPTSPDSVTSAFDVTADNAIFARAFSSRADGRLSPVQFIGPTLAT